MKEAEAASRFVKSQKGEFLLSLQAAGWDGVDL